MLDAKLNEVKESYIENSGFPDFSLTNIRIEKDRVRIDVAKEIEEQDGTEALRQVLREVEKEKADNEVTVPEHAVFLAFDYEGTEI